MAEGVIEQFPLSEPRGVGRGQPGTPPALAVGEIVGRLGGDVAGTAVLNQEDPSKSAVLPSERIQRRNVVVSVVGLQADRLHLTGVDDQEGQEVDGAMPGVLELLLL